MIIIKLDMFMLFHVRGFGDSESLATDHKSVFQVHLSDFLFFFLFLL